jgi:signal transduction histidine kinase
VLLLSRSPRALFRGLYEDRGKILLGIALIFVTLVVLSGLLSRGITRPIEVLSTATRGLARGQGAVPAPPPTAAIEIQALYADFAAMAEAIVRRSRYLRDFAHAVSHEFKTPLASIRGTIEILEDHGQGMTAGERQGFLANIAIDAARLTQLTSRLLDLARADMAEPETDAACDLAALLPRIADAYDGSLSVAARILADTPIVAIPPPVLETILTGLIDNSRQSGACTVTLTVRREAATIALEVADDGPGIPPADRARVFEPFFTGTRASGGTGLGLPIARSLLATAGGTIALVDSKKGARFVLSLPFASQHLTQ